MKPEIEELIRQEIASRGVDAVNEINQLVYENNPVGHNPVAFVRWVNVDDVEANDYNPNAVAKNEMKLLLVSINHDGYTQPVVTIFDEAKQKYVIIDGFHRFTTMKSNKDLREKNFGRLPVVVLEKSIKDRMASTVRHNRARGKHSVGGMGFLIKEFKDKGWDDAAICAEIGLEPDELVRLQNNSGVASLFKGVGYGKTYEESYTMERRTGQREEPAK